MQYTATGRGKRKMRDLCINVCGQRGEAGIILEELSLKDMVFMSIILR